MTAGFNLISVNRELIFKNMADVVKVRQNTCTPFGQTKFVDFDGDDQTDLGYFRASDRTWLYRSTRTESNVSISGFGNHRRYSCLSRITMATHLRTATFSRSSTGTWHIMDPAGGVETWAVGTERRQARPIRL